MKTNVYIALSPRASRRVPGGRALQRASNGRARSSRAPQCVRGNTLHLPCYDNNGNVTRYLDANGATVAQYVIIESCDITENQGAWKDGMGGRL